jgi:hypothetical protein
LFIGFLFTKNKKLYCFYSFYDLNLFTLSIYDILEEKKVIFIAKNKVFHLKFY